jgi:hypothetical protein
MKVYTGSAWVMAYVPGDAASISFTPYSTIASNNVQGAIQELTDEKLNLTGGTLTGNLTAPAFIPNGSTAPSNGVYLPSANNVAISTNGTGRLFVDSSGRLGLGTSSPVQPLEVVTANGGGIALRPNAGNATQGLLFYDTGGGPYGFVKYDHQASAMSFGTNNTVRATLDSSGRLGIGTTSPAFGAGDGLEVARSGVSTIRVSSNTQGVELRSDAGTGTLETRGAFPLLFGIQGTERARIDSSGRFLVGTTSGSGKVTVSGNSIGTTVALTDAATVAVDLSLANYYTLTLGGSRTLGAPSNQNAGQSGVIVITQDGTGSRTLAYNSVWKFPGGTAPTLTITANAVDVLVYYVESATRITARVLSDVK